MTRLILILAVAVCASLAAPTMASAATCANSFPADGHPGPWRTSNNGGTLHGNTVHVSCPGPNVHWHNSYCLQEAVTTFWVNVAPGGCPDQAGNGTPTDYSVLYSPFACSDDVFRTHVVNLVTGGTMNKPAGGGGVHITC